MLNVKECNLIKYIVQKVWKLKKFTEKQYVILNNYKACYMNSRYAGIIVSS